MPGQIEIPSIWGGIADAGNAALKGYNLQGEANRAQGYLDIANQQQAMSRFKQVHDAWMAGGMTDPQMYVQAAREAGMNITEPPDSPARALKRMLGESTTTSIPGGLGGMGIPLKLPKAATASDAERKYAGIPTRGDEARDRLDITRADASAQVTPSGVVSSIESNFNTKYGPAAEQFVNAAATSVPSGILHSNKRMIATQAFNEWLQTNDGQAAKGQERKRIKALFDAEANKQATENDFKSRQLSIMAGRAGGDDNMKKLTQIRLMMDTTQKRIKELAPAGMGEIIIAMADGQQDDKGMLSKLSGPIKKEIEYYKKLKETWGKVSSESGIVVPQQTIEVQTTQPKSVNVENVRAAYMSKQLSRSDVINSPNLTPDQKKFVLGEK